MGTPRVDLAWATGLFEGEGSLGVYGNGGVGRVSTMRLVMSDEDIVRRFAAIVGVGRVDGPLAYKNSVKPLWSWKSTRTYDCARLLARMWPLLSLRRQAQAQPILDRAENQRKGLRGRAIRRTRKEG